MHSRITTSANTSPYSHPPPHTWVHSHYASVPARIATRPPTPGSIATTRQHRAQRRVFSYSHYA
eukprot:1905124-Rhodomonas_salina.1